MAFLDDDGVEELASQIHTLCDTEYAPIADVETLQEQVSTLAFATTVLAASGTKNINTNGVLSAIIYINATATALQSEYIVNLNGSGLLAQTAVKSSSNITIAGTLNKITISNSNTSTAARITIIVSNGTITSIT